MSTANVTAQRIAILCVGAFVGLNVAFYLLSGSYFESHREIVAGVSQPSYSAAQMMHVRVTFAVFSGVVAALGFLAGLWPRVVGHLIPLLIGAVDLVASIFAFAREAPGVVGLTLLVCGIVLPVLAWHSYRGSRAAWAFLVAICGVFAVVELFGAPKVRGALDIGLWTTMILPGVNAVAVAALVALRGEYVDGTMTVPQHQSAPREDGLQRRSRGPRQLGIGVLLLVVGIVITAATYGSASAQGGTYIIAYGPIVVGIINIIRGLTSMNS